MRILRPGKPLRVTASEDLAAPQVAGSPVAIHQTAEFPPAEPGAADPVTRLRDQQLVDQVLQGDDAAIVRFVREYGPVMLGEIRRILARAGRVRDAEDVLQRVFMELLRDDAAALKRWNPTLGRSLGAYLKVLAGFRARSLLRGRVATEILAGDVLEQLAQAPHDLLHRDGMEQVEVLLERFAQRDPEWPLFKRCFIDGAPIAEIAAELGLTVTAAYQRRYRVGKRLLAFLEEDSE